MLIATWNVNSLKIRLEQSVELLQKYKLDILCLQEIKLTDEKFPLQEFEKIGYRALFLGQPTYNGVAIIFKDSLKLNYETIQYNLPNFNDEQKRLIKADFTFNNKVYSVICIYIPNGQDIYSEKFTYKITWLNALYKYITELNNNHSIILAGDYNITVDDLDVYNPMLCANQILCSPQERQFFIKIKELNFFDSQRIINKAQQKIYTWWDYRANNFNRNIGFRIDHIFVNKNLHTDIVNCFVEKEFRNLERPSDHAPVILELQI